MTDHLETLLRDALDDLATSAPTPSNLAGIALRRSRRQRRRAVALTCSAVAVAVAAAIGAGASAGLLHAPKPTPPADKPRHNVVLSYCSMADGPEAPSTYTRLRNPDTGAYEKVPYGCAVPSPDGRRALVTSPRSPVDVAPPQSRLGVWDRRSGQIRWFTLDLYISYYDMAYAWSPDGKRLLFTKRRADQNGVPTGLPTMLLVDPDTLLTTEVSLFGSADIETVLTWRPDGRHVATAVRGKDGRTRGLAVYDLTGHLERTIPAAGLMFGYWYSPNGSLMVLSSDRDGYLFIVADATTGAERFRLTLPRYGQSYANFLGWYDDEHLTFAAARTRPSEPATLHVMDLTGQPTGTFALDFSSSLKIYGSPPQANR